MKLSAREISSMIELSAVRAEHGVDDIHKLVDCAHQHQCCLVTTLPAQGSLARKLLGQGSAIGLGGNVGFPSGGHTTAIKVAEARELVEIGCTELDMVINIGALVSGHHAEVLNDVHSVVEAAGALPVKVILECHHLNQAQILRACDLCIEAGAAFIKTGTGWAPTGATLENVELIKAHVGDAILVKASGGVRGLHMLLELYRRGARRFGISLRGATNILEECAALPGGEIEF